MRSVPLSLALAFGAVVLLPTTPARAADKALDVTSTISAVTVYPDRAQITRVAHVELSPGSYAIRFNKLPANMMADSVRVGGSGSAVATLHGFDMKTTYLGNSPDKQVAALEGRKNGVEDQLRTLNDERAVHERQLQVFIATAKRAGDSLATQLAAGKAKLADWQSLLGYLKQQQLDEAIQIHNLDRKRGTLRKQQARIDAELEKLNGFRQEEVRQIPVTVEVTRGGTLDLSLEYVVPGARWTPAYDARLDSNGDHLDWRYYGVVSQQTGEDWNGVRLELSTAAPAAGSTPPVVPSWFLSLNDGAPGQSEATAQSFGRANNVQQAPAPVMHKPKASLDEKDRDREADEPQAAVTNQGTSVTLAVPRDVSIPSDGEPHQTPIGRAAFIPHTSYRVVPRVTPAAYLMVETTQTGPWPILPGPVKAFVGHDYVGTAMLANDIVPGQRFSLPLGVDRGIQVRRSRLDKVVGTSGLLRKDGFAEYKYEVNVTNYKSRAETIQVVEAVPQSTDDVIRILLDRSSLPSMKENPPGQTRWEIKLAPGERKALHWGYRVEYPNGVEPNGLE